jgi:hypothetical protein
VHEVDTDPVAALYAKANKKNGELDSFDMSQCHSSLYICVKLLSVLRQYHRSCGHPSQLLLIIIIIIIAFIYRRNDIHYRGALPSVVKANYNLRKYFSANRIITIWNS